MADKNNDKHQIVSRRSFLRRAGTDALATGAAIIPGLPP